MAVIVTQQVLYGNLIRIDLSVNKRINVITFI